MNRKEFEEKYTQQEMLKIELDAYVKEREELNKTLQEIVMTEAAIEKVLGGEKLLANIGSGTFVKTRVIDNENVLISIGSGIVIDTSLDEAKRILGERITKLRKADFEYMKRINEIAVEIERLQKELEKLARGG